MTADLKFHPLADIFPLMEGAEFDELVADIKKTGQLFPILTFKGLILDGRNRYRACLAAGKEPDVKALEDLGCTSTDVDDGELVDFVISTNIHRRHLAAEQKREIIAKLLKATPEKSNNAVAKAVKADDKTVASVRRELERRSEIPNVETRTDTKGRKQPAKKSRGWSRKRYKAHRARKKAATAERRRRREAREVAWQDEATQLAIDLIKLDRDLAQRLHAHLGEGMWLKDALRRGLGRDDSADWITPTLAQGNGDDPGPIPDAARDGAS